MAKDEASIPAWQKPASTDPKGPADANDTPKDTSQPSDPESLPSFEFTEVKEMPPVPTRAEAAQFLEHPGTKAAALEDKIAFLELKGVQRADIEALVPEAKKHYADELDKLKAEAEAEAREAQAKTNPEKPPPVIMYPEYLMQRRKPPPLVTTNFLIGTMYAVAGTVAGIYGLSKYVLDPMHDKLTEARHDLFTHTDAHMDEVNSRLEALAPGSAAKPAEDDDDQNSKSGESDDSEPTDLFHKDVGVQTTPLSRNASAWSLSDAAAEAAAADPLSHQESRLKSLAANVRDLAQSAATSSGKQKNLTDQMDALKEFLLAIGLPAAHGRYKNPNFSNWSSIANRPPVGDELDRFRAEVSRTKGLMLSTRNFPRTT